MRYFLLLGMVLMMAFMNGCQNPQTYLGDPEQPYPPVREPEVGDILHLPTGVYVSPATLLEHVRRPRVVFVGETHDNPASHRLQEDILMALAESNPGRVTLAMEMFTPAQQPVLDRWSAGELEEKEFLKQVGWYENWRMNFAYYRPLLEYCRAQRIPILALNVEKALKQKAGRMPFDALDPADQQRLPEMDHGDPYQRAMVEAVFSDHAMGGGMLEGFQRVQTLWDETMAANLADYLEKQGPAHQVVVVAGGNHVRYGFGIPRRMFRRTPASYLLVGSTELEVPEDKQDRLMDVVKPDYPMPPYHFLAFTRYEDLDNPGVKLGVMLDQADNGLLVKQVVPDSVAQHNDLQAGDLLIQIDQQTLSEPFDLIYELQQTRSGSSVELTLERNGERLRKIILFPEPETSPETQNMR